MRRGGRCQGHGITPGARPCDAPQGHESCEAKRVLPQLEPPETAILRQKLANRHGACEEETERMGEHGPRRRAETAVGRHGAPSFVRQAFHRYRFRSTVLWQSASLSLAICHAQKGDGAGERSSVRQNNMRDGGYAP